MAIKAANPTNPAIPATKAGAPLVTCDGLVEALLGEELLDEGTMLAGVWLIVACATDDEVDGGALVVAATLVEAWTEVVELGPKAAGEDMLAGAEVIAEEVLLSAAVVVAEAEASEAE